MLLQTTVTVDGGTDIGGAIGGYKEIDNPAQSLLTSPTFTPAPRVPFAAILSTGFLHPAFPFLFLFNTGNRAF